MHPTKINYKLLVAGMYVTTLYTFYPPFPSSAFSLEDCVVSLERVVVTVQFPTSEGHIMPILGGQVSTH
jgi:hypothetical protein